MKTAAAYKKNPFLPRHKTPLKIPIKQITLIYGIKTYKNTKGSRGIQAVP